MTYPKSVRADDPQSVLTLSAVPTVDRQDDRSAAEAIERQLARIDLARRAGADDLALRLTDDLIDYVWGPVVGGAA